MDWLSNTNSILALIVGLCGLISAGIGAYFAIKNFVLRLKEKSQNELWCMIMQIANEAMKEAERSGRSGAEKKDIVINTVKAGCKAAGLDMEIFLDQLSDYIDNAIEFANSMNMK